MIFRPNATGVAIADLGVGVVSGCAALIRDLRGPWGLDVQRKASLHGRSAR